MSVSEACQEIYDKYWKTLIEDPDGHLDKEQVMKELCDYLFVINQACIVYGEVTGGQITEPKYYADVIVTLAGERMCQMFSRALLDEILPKMESPTDYEIILAYASILSKEEVDTWSIARGIPKEEL